MSQRKSNRPFLIYSASVVILLAAFCFAAAEEWYETVEAKHSDPFGLRVYCINLLGAIYNMGGLHPAQGLVYVKLSKREYDQILGAADQSRVRKSRMVDKQIAKKLREHLQERAAHKIPIILDVIPKIPHGVTLANTALELLLKESRATAQELSGLVAEGGQLLEVVAIRQADSDKPILSSSLMYSVTVGQEKRKYVLASSSLAVKVVP